MNKVPHPTNKQHSQALNRMSKPKYRYITEIGFRPRKCPYCQDGQLRQVYQTGKDWCYTCGWQTGMPVPKVAKEVIERHQARERERVLRDGTIVTPASGDSRPVGTRVRGVASY